MAKALYICYFGVHEPLVQTQVIPYLIEIQKGGTDVSLLTFEPEFKTKWDKRRLEDVRAELAGRNITWHAVGYHKRFSAIATAYDIFVGVRFIKRLLRRGSIDIFHCRSHVPALIGALARKGSKHRPKILFDIRGFFPEEYVDSGNWPENGVLFRMAKKVEKWLMKTTDGFVVLTEAARNILFPESAASGYDRVARPVEVIPTCVDLNDRFDRDPKADRNEIRSKLKLDARIVFIHVGTLGGIYLTEEIADLLAIARKRYERTFAMFLTQSDPDLVEPLLRTRGFSDGDYFIAKVKPAEVTAYLHASDVAISMVRSTYSAQSRSPTKIPEYLAAGLPVIANSGVGDVDELFRNDPVGALITRFSDNEYSSALDQIEALGDVSTDCRMVAKREFDLQNVGGVKYRRLYSRLLEGNG